jgi:hypothetical protein
MSVEDEESLFNDPRIRQDRSLDDVDGMFRLQGVVDGQPLPAQPAVRNVRLPKRDPR